MLPTQRNPRRERNDSCFGLTSRKHRILLRQIFSRSSPRRKQITLVFFAAAGFSLMLSLIVYLGLKYIYGQTTCTRPECILAANRLLEGMNASADPCEDFYEYVCGNWQHAHSTSDEINSWFMDRSKYLNNEIINILKENLSDLDPKPVSQMKDFYKMCMDTSYLNSKGLQPLYDILDLLELPRMFPHPGISQDFSIAKVLAMSQKLLNLDILMEIHAHFNSTLNTTFLTISPAAPKSPNLRPNKKSYTMRTVSADEFLVHQIRYMTAVMKALTSDGNTEDISRAAMQIILLDAQLKLVLNKVGLSFTGRFFRVKDLEKYMFQENKNGDPPFNWQDYISALTHGSNVSLQMNDIIVVANHKYFRALGMNLMMFKRIDFQRYVWWKIIDDLAFHTTDRIRSYKFIFYEHVYNGFIKYSRSGDCLSLVKSTFLEAITYVLGKRNEVSNSVMKIESILSRIKHSFKQTIKNSAWLDFYTKAASIKKVDNIEAFIGYPEKSLNSTFLTERFANVNIIPNDFMSSLMNIRSIPTKRIMNFINGHYGCTLENDSFSIDYTEISSFYQRKLNSIYMLAGIIQYPFFMKSVESLNYGAVGFILGHELMHGLDREGIRFDWNGHKRKVWNKNMTEAFNQQAECFINQYRQYYIIDNQTVYWLIFNTFKTLEQVDGYRTLSENMADNEGLRLALRAYKDYVAENGVEPVLPAFENFSHQQLLFMSFANIYCMKEPDFYRRFMLDKVHSPQRIRIIGTLSNMPEFAKSWNCPPNVPMNPYNKCSLW